MNTDRLLDALTLLLQRLDRGCDALDRIRDALERIADAVELELNERHPVKVKIHPTGGTP